MSASRYVRCLAVACLLFAGPGRLVTAFAQPTSAQSAAETGVVPDDALTLVVGTRFVRAATAEASAKTLFDTARVELSEFNETDHCVDNAALEVAQEYFRTLGRVMSKAGYYYVVPEADIQKAIATCQRTHTDPPKAWSNGKTQIVAFGRVVATEDAPALEKMIR